MRKIIRDTFVLAALMILMIFSFSIVQLGLTEEIKLVYEVFGLALVLSVFNYVFDEKTSLTMLVSYLIKYAVVSVTVILFGFIVGWFYRSNFWMGFIYVGVISAIVYALDSVRTEKDIEDINEMVKRTNNEKVEVKPLNKRNGWKVLLVLLASMIVLFLGSLAGFVSVRGSGQDVIASYFLNAMIITGAAAAVLGVLMLVYVMLFRIRRSD